MLKIQMTQKKWITNKVSMSLIEAKTSKVRVKRLQVKAW